MFSHTNYFLKIQFSWNDIRPYLSFDDDVWKESKTNEDYSVSFSGGNYLPIADSQKVNFEYYINPSQAIFCQQTHRFFKLPNIIYPKLLHGVHDKEEFSVDCSFDMNFTKDKAAFQITYTKGISSIRHSIKKTLIVLFNAKFLNLNVSSSMACEDLPYDIYLIEGVGEYKEKNNVYEIDFDKEKMWLRIGSTSMQDIKSTPYQSEIHSYLESKKKK